ncbi:hypothetical protein [Nesterenkonia ebinurensis]|uniref:hypothetical protein n=1 Tax=Nesterenkonia ebinurensis TaxID=2608252 RepID=UPI00123CB0E9|nr:hypothetical protein [Nesterenkonia ebinurensis]
MTESRFRECVRCGLVGTTMMLPTGPICYRCRRNIAYHPAVCPECFELRPIAYPSMSSYGVLVCAGCAGEVSVFACAQCGSEAHPYGAIRCARCILAERLTALLTDPATGAVHIGLRPLYDELAAAARPQSVLTWLKKPPATGARLLGLMARGELPISHDTFRELPADRSHNYLRDLLAATGVLPLYQAPIEQMERWLDIALAPLAADDSGLIGRYARWHLLRHLRQVAERGNLTKTALYGARSNVNAATRLARWATNHHATIASLTQPQLESYLAERPGARNSLQGFVAWLGRTRANPRISILTRKSTLPEVIVADADRWEQIDQLLHDEQIALYARIGGLFTLLFAQPLQTIVAMRANQITIKEDGRVLVTFDTIPIEMPPGLDELIRRYLRNPAPARSPTETTAGCSPAGTPAVTWSERTSAPSSSPTASAPAAPATPRPSHSPPASPLLSSPSSSASPTEPRHAGPPSPPVTGAATSATAPADPT